EVAKLPSMSAGLPFMPWQNHGLDCNHLFSRYHCWHSLADLAKNPYSMPTNFVLVLQQKSLPLPPPKKTRRTNNRIPTPNAAFHASIVSRLVVGLIAVTAAHARCSGCNQFSQLRVFSEY